MKKSVFLSSLVLILLSLIVACSSNKSSESASINDSIKIERVKTMIIHNESITRTTEYTSSLLPFEEVHLAPSSPGRIENFFVDVSDNVTKGQVLVQMDRTQLQQAKINLLNLETDFRRYDTLKSMESIAEQQYDQLKARYDIAKSSYDFLLENTQLKAPFSGIVSGKYFEDGEIYSGTPVPAVGKPAVLSIVQINNLKARLNLSSNYYPLISLGMKVEMKTDLFPDMIFKGDVYRIYPTIDNATKTFIVEVKIQNQNLKLRPGMFGKIQLNMGKGSALLVPSIALIKQTGTNNMFAFVNENNIAAKKQIKTGQIIDDKTEILSGLSEGDELIIIGQNKLEDQEHILVIK
ncbi:MAG: efflux RND transporter periplasmic adaptor subunit [Bacteroidales bacterium]